jgi:hypothetical protein
MGLLVGFLPGCGPTIMFASIFGAGMIGMAAMTTAAIGQDGDAGFPLLLNDKPTYFTVKFLNLIPAVIVGTSLLYILG